MTQAMRAECRELKLKPEISWWEEGGRMLVSLLGRKGEEVYRVEPISTDLGGAAFRWTKRGGEFHSVLASGVNSSCDCAGFCYTGGCKHLHATLELLAAGELTVAPGSGACDEDEVGYGDAF